MADNNIVPVKQDVENQFTPVYEEVDLNEFIENCFSSIDMEDVEEELRRYKKWMKNRAFYRGNQRGFWDSKKRTWVTVDVDSLSPSEASMLVINNQFRPQVKTLAKEFSRSQTRVRAMPISDSQRSILTGRFADALIKYHQPMLMPESAKQLEAKYLLLTGNSFRYTRYNKNKDSVKVPTPILGTKVLDAYIHSTCPECGHKVEGKEITCPKCEGIMETVEVPEKVIENAQIGEEYTNAGDLDTEIVDPVEIKMWAGGKSLADSPYLRRRRFVKGEFVLNTFPFYTPNENAKLSDSAQAQWQFSDTSSNVDTANTIKGMYEYTQLWLDIGFYRRKKLRKAVKFKKLVKGKYIDYELPAGTILEKEFPNGMYVCRVGKDILGYYPENKLDHWLHVQFDINVDGAWADGLEDSVMNQQIINEYTSLSVENILYNASPKLIINPQLINPVTATGRPKDIMLMSDNARGTNLPKDAFAQIHGMSLTQDVMMGIESAKRDMREQTGALLGFNGQGDPNITTATGMSIARDSALALVSTPLAIRAEVDEKWCWQILNLTKKYWNSEKYKFLLGKYNDAEAQAFKDSALKEELTLWVEPNSWLPQTTHEKALNLNAYLTAFSIPFGYLNPQIPQPIRDYGSQLYNIPLDFDELYPDIRIAHKRIDTAKILAEQLIPQAMQAAQEFAKLQDLEGGQQFLYKTSVIISDAMGIEEDIDDHIVFMTEYKKWLKTDEGQNAHPILRQAIKLALADHKMFYDVEQAEQLQMAAIQQGMGQGQGMTGGNSKAWESQETAESPFMANPPDKGIQDFSDNADNSDL